MRSTLSKLILVLLALCIPAAMQAQNNSSMTGSVTDATGAVLSGSTVTLTNAHTGARFTQTTDAQGSYRFANVPPAPGYTATFSHEGFASVTVQDIALQVGSTRTQDAKLLAGANTAVEVTASNSAVTLNTSDASIGNNLDVRSLVDLPIQNRSSVAVLFQLQPGVANGSVTGARTDQSSVTLDGMDVNDIGSGSTFAGSSNNAIVAGAPVDAVQEFRGLVAGLPSSEGTGAGGQFQLVTKSGVNQFHGDLNEYHRDTATSANSWFNNNAGVARPPLIRNQFGGAIGGPVIIPKLYNGKDKLFFFFDFNNSRIIQSANVERIVPLDSFRNGNVSYIRNTDSATGAACAATSRQNTTPTCIGQLTPAQVQQLDPQRIGESAAFFQFINNNYPRANDPAYSSADGVNLGGYRFNFPEPDFLYNYVGRVDYNLTPRQHVFARFNVIREDATQSANAFPSTTGTTNPFQDRSYGYVVSHVWQLGNNKVNQFYYGDTVQKYNFPVLNYPLGTTEYTLGASPTTNTNLYGPFVDPSSQKRRIPIPEVRDDFNWQLGSHSIGFGGTFKFIKTNSQLINDFNTVTLGLGGENLSLDATVRPTVANGFGTNGIRTAGTTSSNVYDSAFALALGRIASVSSAYNYNATGTQTPQGQGAVRAYRFFQTELYVGDTWKVTPHLTLTYGLRYQLYSVPYEAHGQESIQNFTFNDYFNLRRAQSASGAQGPSSLPFFVYNLGGKANNAAPLYNPSYKDFGPRFAFAYNPAYSPKTVFNGSFAMVYDRTVINAVNFIQDQSSYLFQNSAARQYGGTGAAGALGAGNPRVGSGLSFTNPNAAPTITRPFAPYVNNAQGTDPNDPFGVPNSPFGLATNQFNTIVDPTLRDPYSLTFNAGVQQEFPGHFILNLNYAGRLGRRLLAQADASQLIDYRDPASGQTMAQAFGTLTQQVRAGQNFTSQPFFENQVGRGYTLPIANAYSSYISNGDFADFIQALQAGGYLNYNVGMASQFASNTFVTNKGTSTYHGLLATLSKNFSQGLQFNLNYTWSHSMDNVSANANYIAASQGANFICDATNPRVCYANSDFDVQNVLNSNFIYQLPIGRGKLIGNGTPRLLDELIGGWSISGIPGWRSGLALGTTSAAYVAGYAENAPAIFSGNRTDVGAHVAKDPTANAVFLFGSQAQTAKALSNFSGPVGLTIGSRNNLRGPSWFTMDAGLAKIFALMPNERLNLKFRADFFNVLNHPVFNLPNMDITSGSFGRISSTPTGTASGGPRVGQFSLRLEF